jgi:hypothetical protein
VLTITQMLRQKGVVGKFVEFYGDGLADLPLADVRLLPIWHLNMVQPVVSSRLMK